ncbi:MAG TPA: hypothetical protein VMM58_04995 [Bacteroidota bacterium]|nr:hypothetical protein [Bacteroidota bacterium]
MNILSVNPKSFVRGCVKLFAAGGLMILQPVVAAGQGQNGIVIKPNLSSSDKLSEWTLDGSGSWQIEDGQLVLTKAGSPSGPIRRPSALAILNSDSLSSVMVQADIQSDVDTSNLHRDLDIVVGYQSPQRFYYVHLAATTDSVHNGIFIVDNANRRRIDSGSGIPRLTGKAWHYVSVIRDGDNGIITVYLDSFKSPVLQAIDTTLRFGRVGFGSFDDTGHFRNIIITSSLR